MANTMWKWPTHKIGQTNRIDVPVGCDLISAAIQDKDDNSGGQVVVVYGIADDEVTDTRPVSIYVAETGKHLPDLVWHAKFLGTVQTRLGSMYHVFAFE